MAEIEVPVLIIGGGSCGLTTSILLSDMGIEHLLVERHPTTSHLPKAHYLNQRTMEVFRQHGIADSVYAVGTPMSMMGKVPYSSAMEGPPFNSDHEPSPAHKPRSRPCFAASDALNPRAEVPSRASASSAVRLCHVALGCLIWKPFNHHGSAGHGFRPIY